MKKPLITLLCFFALAFFQPCHGLTQSVDDAKKNLYYGRTTSAKQALDKLIAADPKNAEAIYWLGQTHLAKDDLKGAKQVYQNAVSAGINDPLISVGIGHVALLEGNNNEARQRFEAAITASMSKKKENPVILNAIGRANADGPATAGEPQYGIDKLKKAAELDPNNADIYVNLGINYLKLGQGGNAYEAFNNALKIDPANAKAKFRLGRLFESQGNREKFLEYYNSAIAGDPAYGPGYLELYEYYALRDVNKAKEYLEKYIANTDKDCNTDFFYADYLFRAGKYEESLGKVRDMENGPCRDYPRRKVLYAYNYERLGDSMKARSNIQSYLSSASPEKIQPSDYAIAATILRHFQGSEDTAISYLKKALEADTVTSHQYQYMDTIAFLYKMQGKVPERLEWLQKSYHTNPNPSNLDIYNIADAATTVGNYTLADSMSMLYIQKYPDQEYGYFLLARSKKAADPDSGKGTAIPAAEQYITFLKSQDSVKNATKIKYQYYYIASVAADKLKNYGMALDVVNKILAIDPADLFGTSAKPVLERALNRKAGDR